MYPTYLVDKMTRHRWRRRHRRRRHRRRWKIKPQSLANNHKKKIFICYVLHTNLFNFPSKRTLRRWNRVYRNRDKRPSSRQSLAATATVSNWRWIKIDNLYLRNLHLNREQKKKKNKQKNEKCGTTIDVEAPSMGQHQQQSGSGWWWSTWIGRENR